MKILLSFFAVSIFLNPAFGQSYLSGMITDAKDPVVGANVYLKNSFDGASSDVAGRYQFTAKAKGPQVLVVTCIGYETIEKDVLLKDEPQVFNFTLKEKFNKLDAVVISVVGLMSDEDKRIKTLNSVDVVTTAGGHGDISRSLTMLPGTQKVAEEGRLFVRGGAGSETKTYIDGLEVMQAYDSRLPNMSVNNRFSPFMFQGTNFSTGGYSAEYGQALSSVLSLTTKDIPESDRMDLSLLSVGGEAAFTKSFENSAAIGKLSYYNLAPYFFLVKQDMDLEKAPEELNANFAFRQRIKENGMLKFYSNLSSSQMSANYTDIDSPELTTLNSLENNYLYLNSSFKSIINGQWSYAAGMAYNITQDKGRSGALSANNLTTGFHGKVVFYNDPADKVSLKMGGEVFLKKYETTPVTNNTIEVDEQLVSVFAEADVYTSNRFVIRTGSRWEYASLADKLSFSPRLSASYKTGDHSSASASWGQFRQTADPQYLFVKESLLIEKADHYLLNYQYSVSGRVFRIDGYYKNYRDLVKFDGDEPYDPTFFSNQGKGYARGVDLFWRDNKTLNNVDYWISYSFLDSERNYRDFTDWRVPNYATRHNFSIVYKHWVESLRSSIGTSYAFTSGRPYLDPNKPGSLEERSPSYQDLSVNWSYLMKTNVIIHASVSNVLGRDNIFGYEYGSVPNEKGEFNSRPVRQAAPRFFLIAVLITFSKDKTVNALPNL